MASTVREVSELKFLEHLQDHSLVPSLEKLFIDFNRDISKETVLQNYWTRKRQ